jgi:hypothetical protein
MNTVGDLIGIGFPLLWHEGVAVVQEVASRVVPGHGVPADKDLRFNEDGTMNVAVASQGPVSVVTALGRLLQRLLPADAPAALCALASENSGDQPTHPTVDAFTRALAFFERPGRPVHLVAVATRLQNHTPPVASEVELDRLRKKVIEGPEERRVTAPVARRSLHPGYAAGGALALVVVVAGARLPVGGLLATVSSLSIFAAPGSSSNPAAPAAAVPSEDSGTPTDAANADSDVPSRHLLTAGRGRSVASHRTTSIVVSAGPLPVVATSVTDVSNHDVTRASQPQPSPAAPAEPTRETKPRADAPRVYSSEDTTVMPAAFVRPQLPSGPQPGPSTGYFDLTVDESGNVVTVRLVSPAGRYEERSLVSAAKAWRFRPALLEGHPVKYRMRVPITLPEHQ